MYAVEVDASDGFELCPADACPVGDAFRPAGPGAEEPRAKFTIIDDIDADLSSGVATRHPSGPGSGSPSCSTSIGSASGPQPGEAADYEASHNSSALVFGSLSRSLEQMRNSFSGPTTTPMCRSARRATDQRRNH